MKHFKTVIDGNKGAKVENQKDVNYALSCKVSVTLGTNFNMEKRTLFEKAVR